MAGKESKLKSGKNRNRLLWSIVALVAIVALVLAGAFLRRQRVRADAGEPQVVTAFVGNLTTQISASGQIVPRREASLAFETGGRVQEVLVQAGDVVQAGDPLLRLETAALEYAVQSARQSLIIQQANLAELLQDPSALDMAAAQAALDSAQAQLDDLLAGPSETERAQALAALDSALATLRAAEAGYATQQDQLTIARAQVDQAKVALDNAQWHYDALLNDWQTHEWAPYSPQAQTLDKARETYQAALEQFELSKTDINDSDLAAAQSQVAQAEANLAALTADKTVEIAQAREQLAQAQANLAKLRDGPTTEQVAVAETRVAQAQVAVEGALANLQKATLTAPFDGIVTAVHLAVGERASGVAVDLVNSGGIEAVIDIDEVDIGAVFDGQQARITLEPWPDTEIVGTVVSIAPRSKERTETVLYQVHLQLEETTLPVRAGMTANARLLSEQRTGVVLIPNRAIIVDRQADKYYAQRVQGDEVQEVQITIGLRNESYTEVTSGLQAGDELVVQAARESLEVGSGPPSSMRELR